MELSERQHLFLEFVKLKHGEQKRKYTGEPYWHHVYEVATAVAKYEDGCIEIALGHDLFEDTECTYEELFEFLVCNGYLPTEAIDIADGITELSDEYTHIKYPQLNRKARKKKEAERLWQVTPRAQSVKYADIINNTLSIVANDKGFAKVYLKEIDEILYGMINGNKELFHLCKSIVADAEFKLNNDQLNLFSEKQTGGHYFHSVDSKDYDFVVYNQDAYELTNEEILPEDLVPLTYKELTPVIQRLKSEAWSCGCNWFFVLQQEGIYLMNVHDEHFWFCKKLSHRFFKMYLDAPTMVQKPKLKLPEEKKPGDGILWCTACEKTPGFHTYIDFKGETRTVTCPICKGTKQYTFKGKAPAEKKS